MAELTAEAAGESEDARRDQVVVCCLRASDRRVSQCASECACVSVCVSVCLCVCVSPEWF